jgi:tetratricopeptide (TPR) repeat protein
VLSDHATLDRVEKVLEYPAHRLLSSIGELSRAAMLSVASEGKELTPSRILPRHDFLASAALRLLPSASLAFIHRRSADVLEKEIAQTAMPTTLLWACADHRQHAGDRGKAISLSMACAEHLLDIGLAGEATAAFQKSLEYCATDDQRLQVLRRLAFAHQLNGEWERSKDVLRSAIRLASNVDPQSNGHNDFELELLAARHQSTLDFLPLLADIIPCVESHDASPSHRVRAAILALKIATDMGPTETLDSIYAHVKPFLHNHEVSEAARLELEMIYRTTRGHEVMAIQDLERFVETAGATGELAYSNALLTAATACRISARYEQGLAFVTKAFKEAVAHNRKARMSRVLVAELRLHVAACAFERAETTLHQLMECPIPRDDDFAQAELQSYKARIALEKGDIPAAAAAFAEIQTNPSTYSPRRRANFLALRLRIRLNQDATADEIRCLVSELETEHLQVRSVGGHDFEAHTLYLGLCTIGEKSRGVQMLRAYVTHRSSEWPIHDRILEALSSFSDSCSIP